MAKRVTIYHNPRCSKSRQTLALLQERGIEPEVVLYLETPPSQKQVLELIGLLGGDPLVLVRKGEEPYRRLGLGAESSAKDVARAVSEHPILLERPIVVVGDKAALGRPPENVLALL
jgi:arsenate reductase (glutaredoxin)